jgi:predicted nucleotide-binding protein
MGTTFSIIKADIGSIEEASGPIVFIASGKDKVMRQSVTQTLRKIGLQPVILSEEPNEGLTIIEKLSKNSNVSKAIALFSPDDMGYPKDQMPPEPKPRTRQNVIFETAYFMASLGRENVIILSRDDKGLEIPSDLNGVLHIVYDNSGRWKYDPIKELIRKS